MKTFKPFKTIVAKPERGLFPVEPAFDRFGKLALFKTARYKDHYVGLVPHSLREHSSRDITVKIKFISDSKFPVTKRVNVNDLHNFVL